MSRMSFPTSPSAIGEQRKFINPTPGFVGANKFGPDGDPTSVAVEPGGEVWLTPEEERMTAEAPRNAADNPFVRGWEEPVNWDDYGQPTAFVHREGMLVLSEEPPRPVASDRYVPPRAAPEPEPEPEEVTGAPPIPEQPPVEGQPSPDEVVATPEAVANNDEVLAQREPTPEQPTRRRAPKSDEEPLPA